MSAAGGQQFAADSELADAIRGSSGSDPVRATLRTDDRVLARVTDGIYRQPGSAIRELLSNAYDADATSVVIKTDRPRFTTISIEDDGVGMSPDAVAHLVRHIGGSAKRSAEGAVLGVTDSADPTRSPGGRKLIGRIGIGLFSVAQLTDRFQIITKTAGDPFRTITTVVLKQFSGAPSDTAGEKDYEAGRVNLWCEPAVDTESHGTTIVLTDVRPQTRDTLQSRNLWAGIDADSSLAPEESRGLKPPRFHIGRVDPANPGHLVGVGAALDAVPWTSGTSPDAAFKKLVTAVWDEAQQGASPNPKLEDIFDYYLQMVWLQLGLAIPAPYVDGHPFDIPFGESAYTFQLPESQQEAPIEVRLSGHETLREKLQLGPASSESDGFEVIVDDLRLQRPLRFRNLPATAHQVKKPILFVGHCREEFAGVAPELSGGPLEFDAYLLWAPKIVPTEHQGVLIRIHGSSGTLFDPTFLRYQVSEQTRLRQITCEIFVTTGLEGALNIDRESFNFAHPHVVYVTRWLHRALTRVASTQKRIAAEIRGQTRDRAAGEAQARLEQIVTGAWRNQADDEGQSPPTVQFVEPVGASQPQQAAPAAPAGGYRFQRAAVFGSERATGLQAARRQALERKLVAIVQLLAAFNLLDPLNEADKEQLVTYLREILEEDS